MLLPKLSFLLFSTVQNRRCKGRCHSCLPHRPGQASLDLCCSTAFLRYLRLNRQTASPGLESTRATTAPTATQRGTAGPCNFERCFWMSTKQVPTYYYSFGIRNMYCPAAPPPPGVGSPLINVDLRPGLANFGRTGSWLPPLHQPPGPAKIIGDFCEKDDVAWKNLIPEFVCVFLHYLCICICIYVCIHYMPVFFNGQVTRKAIF